MSKLPGIPPTLMGPSQRAAAWPPPKLISLAWGTAIQRTPNGGVLLCLLSPDGSEGIQLGFDAIGWAAFARDVQSTLASNGAGG